MTATEKPPCVCGHSHAMHRLGPCALYKGPGPVQPGGCWCDTYDPNDAEARSKFPVEPIPYKEDDDPK